MSTYVYIMKQNLEIMQNHDNCTSLDSVKPVLAKTHIVTTPFRISNKMQIVGVPLSESFKSWP